MEVDPDRAMKGIFHAFLINATVITLVFYFLFARNMLLFYRGLKQKSWPPANFEVGVKTKCFEGKEAQQRVIKGIAYSLLLLCIPLNWQLEAYRNYQNYNAYMESSKKLEKLRIKYENFMEETPRNNRDTHLNRC